MSKNFRWIKNCGFFLRTPWAEFVENHRQILTSIVCAVASLMTIPCHAQMTNYSTLVEPGDGYNAGGSYFIIGTAGAGYGFGYQSLGFQFIPSVSGYLDQINLALFAGNTNIALDNANIYVDANRYLYYSPGAVLESFLNVPVAQGSYTDMPLTSVNSVAQPYLQAGVPYWLVLQAASPTGVLLADETTGAIAAPLSAQFYSPSNNWTAEGNKGTLAYDIVVVPEPSTWILFVISASVLLKSCQIRKERGMIS